MKGTKRVYLRKGQQIELARQLDGRNRETYTVRRDFIGQGHSAVCYEAVRNSDGMTGKLKEFYPLELAQDYGKKLRRFPNGQLVTEQDIDGQFDRLCEDYLKNYKRLIRVMREDPQNEVLKNFIQVGDILYGCFSGGTATVYIWSAGIQGQNYQERLAEIHQKPEEESARKLYEILQTVWTLTDCIRSLHMAGLMHLDIKPDNFLVPLRSDRTVNPGSISMFDIDTLYSVGQDIPRMLGTSGYRAPELAKGKADNRSDIYSIGAMLFFAIMGGEEKMPFGRKYRGEDYEDLDRLVRKSRLVTGSGLDETGVSGLILLLKKCLAEEPEERYGSCTSLLVDLGLVRDRVSRYVTLMSLSEVSKRNLWDGAHCWLENVRKEGRRFAGLNIDRNIMPYADQQTEESSRLPVYVYDNSQQNGARIPLMDAINNTPGNIFLVGEGGIGKTTALMGIMEDAYNGKTYTPGCQVPLFVELSYAPDTYGAVYENGRSSFIRRSVCRLLRANGRVNQRDCRLSGETDDVYNEDSRNVVEPVNVLFTTKPADGQPEYFLLLDGLNEVSRSIVKDNSGRILHTAVSMIISEIQELLTDCPNVRIILTSRADEGASGIGMYLTKLYLSGIEDAEISNYLRRNGLDEAELAAVEANEKLIEILRIPLFLIMYTSVHARENLCTRGDILRMFFNEKSFRIGSYTIQDRLTSIEENRKSMGNSAFNTSISARAQWFILDFLLPEIAWTMEKNDNYFLSLEEIRQIINPILNGNGDTDICGKFACRLFTKFSAASDVASNIKQAAGELLELDNGEHKGERTGEAIINCCLYSLGVMQENRGLYGFVHQHIRDYLASIKIINSLRMAVFLNEEHSPSAFDCLTDYNSAPLDTEIRTYIGEILQEYKNKPMLQNGKWRTTVPAEACDQNLLSRSIDLYRGRFHEKKTGYGVWNGLMIMNEARGSLACADLRKLDLNGLNLNGIKLFNADFSGSLVSKETLFRNGHSGAVTGVAFTPDGKFIISSSEDGSIRKWDATTLSYIVAIKEYPVPISGISLSPDGQYLAVLFDFFKGIEVLKLEQAQSVSTIALKKRNVSNAVFSSDGRYFALVTWNLRKWLPEIQVLDANTFVQIRKSEDRDFWTDAYHEGRSTVWRITEIAFHGDELAYVKENDAGSARIKIWDINRNTSYELTCDKFISSINYDSSGRYIFAAKAYSITAWDLNTKKMEKLGPRIDWPDMDSYIKAINLSSNGKFLLVGRDFNDIIVLENNGDLNFSYYGRFQGHSDSVVSLQCYNGLVVSGSEDGQIGLWNLDRMEKSGFIYSSQPYLTKAIYHPAGRQAILIGNDTNAQIWNIDAGKCEKELEGDFEPFDCDITWPDGNLVAVAMFETGINLYDFTSAKYLHSIETDDSKSCSDWAAEVKFNPEGKYLLISTINGRVIIHDLCNDDQNPFQINEIPANHYPRTAFHPDGTSVLIARGAKESPDYDSYNKKLELWNIKSKSLYKKYDPYDMNLYGTMLALSFTSSIASICYSHNARYIASLRGVFGGTITLYDTEKECWFAVFGSYIMGLGYLQNLMNGVPSSLCNYNKKWREYIFMSFSHNDRIFLALTKKGEVDMWDTENFQEIRTRNNLEKIFKGVRYLEFSPDDKYIMTSDRNRGTARIWNVRDMSLVKTLKYAPGLRVQGADLRKLHPESALSKEDMEILRAYGAWTE